MLNININLLTLFFISTPIKYSFISFPFIINKLEIALTSVSIVLNVNAKAKIKMDIIIKLLLDKIKLKKLNLGSHLALMKKKSNLCNPSKKLLRMKLLMNRLNFFLKLNYFLQHILFANYLDEIS